MSCSRPTITRVTRRMPRSSRQSGALSRPVMEVLPRLRGLHRFLLARNRIRTVGTSARAVKPCLYRGYQVVWSQIPRTEPLFRVLQFYFFDSAGMDTGVDANDSAPEMEHTAHEARSHLRLRFSLIPFPHRMDHLTSLVCIVIL